MYIFIVNFFQSKYLNVINYFYVMLISLIFIISFFQSVVPGQFQICLFFFFDEKISRTQKHVTPRSLSTREKLFFFVV